MQAIDRKALRDLWHMRGQALAIALVIAAGIAMLVMSATTLDSLRSTRTQLYQQYRFSHIWSQVRRAPEGVAARVAELPGVNAVETRVAAGGKLALAGFDKPIEALVLSLPDQGEPQQNRLYLRSGRMPEPFAQGEALVSDAFAQAHRLKPGQTLRATIYGRSQQFTIVGIAVSPEFLYQIKPGALFPDYERYAIVWTHRRALAAATNMQGAFNQIVLQLAPDASEADTIARVDQILTRYGSRGAIGRMDQLSYRFLYEELRQLGTLAWLFPLIFLGVATFLLNVVFKRMIGTQRDQVAILKAFGYSTFDVMLHYALIVTLICLLGLALGVGFGIWLGSGLAALYQVNFRFPFLNFTISPLVIAVGAGASLLAALLGSGWAVYAAAREPVAQAMRPPAPERYRPTLAERLGMTRWLSQPTRMILRQIERRPFKALVTTIGLAFAGAIVLLSRFQTGSIDHMVDIQYRLSQQQDITASFIETMPRKALGELRTLPGVREVNGARNVPVRLRHENRHVLTSIRGLPGEGRLNRPVNTQLQRLELPPQGLMLNAYVARKLGVSAGDMLWVEALEGRQRHMQLPVTRLVQEYTGTTAYMELDALNRAMGDGDVISEALLKVDADAEAVVFRELDRRPGIAGAQSRLAAIQAMYKTIEQITGTFTSMTVLMGMIINFGVVYNAVRIALAERGRELASLRVMGFTQGEVSYILLGELAVLVLASIPLGFLVGDGLIWFLVQGLQSDIYRVPMYMEPSAYAFCTLVTVVSAMLSALAVYWRIRKLNLIEVLKTRE